MPASPASKTLALCGWLAGAATPALAQVDAWTVITEAEDPTIIAMAVHCPVFDNDAGRAFCLAIGCTPQDPFSFGFSYAGFERPDTWDHAATYTIDGREFDPVPMRLIALGTFETIAAAYDESRHAALLDALRRGFQMEVRFADDALPPQAFPLNRSLVSIDRARALCAASDAVPATTIIGQRVDIWDMLAGDPDDDHLMDLLPDGTLRLTLNGAETLSRWSEGADGALCLEWPGEASALCGVPDLVRTNLTLRLLRDDGTLAVRLTGTLLGPAP